MTQHETQLETHYGSTWHRALNGWDVMVIHRPGYRAVCFIRPGSDDAISLPYSVTRDLFDPICEALEAAYQLGLNERTA
jgi:hypothetical protein